MVTPRMSNGTSKAWERSHRVDPLCSHVNCRSYSRILTAADGSKLQQINRHSRLLKIHVKYNPLVKAYHDEQ
jgi:hypothetical protein